MQQSIYIFILISHKSFLLYLLVSVLRLAHLIFGLRLYPSYFITKQLHCWKFEWWRVVVVSNVTRCLHFRPQIFIAASQLKRNSIGNHLTFDFCIIWSLQSRIIKNVTKVKENAKETSCSIQYTCGFGCTILQLKKLEQQ